MRAVREETSPADDRVRVDDRPGPDPDLRADDGVGSDVHVRPEQRRRADARRGMNPRLGERHRREQQDGLRNAMLPGRHLAANTAQAAPPSQDLDLELQPVSRHHWTPEFGAVDADDVHLQPARVLCLVQQPDAGCLRQALHDQDPRHHRRAGEVSFEELL